MKHTFFYFVLAVAMVASSSCAIADENTENRGYGLVNVSVASLRNSPSHVSELETQVIYGTPVEILSDSLAEWCFCRTPDGYKAYIHRSAFIAKTASEMERWRSAQRVIVTASGEQHVVADTLSLSSRDVVSDVTWLSVLEGYVKAGSSFASVSLPDGRKGYLPAGSVADFRQWSERAPDADAILDAAFAMRGVPYLWGGSSSKAVDCSGFTQLCFFSAGLLLPRNASQQAMIGEEVDFSAPSALRRADLLFFGNDTRITHVAIFDGDTRFIHASGCVYESSFDPEHPLYIPRSVIKAVRVLGCIGDASAVMPVAGHPWYFNN